MLLILLCGGDKSTQAKDIEKAHEIAKEWENHGKD
jgi:putative addiction module killer protein